ncbi:MAG: hypothetical protein HC902_10960 [Calothrix sp. SM1_5_4]|nr:hypothetical protein [Calothrix sp. SM1_5_4]
MEAAREAQKEALEQNREKLGSAHGKETRAIRQERDYTVRNLQRDYNAYRDQATQEKQDMRLQSLQEKQKSSNNLLRAVTRERMAREESENELRGGFKDGLEVMRERYEQKMEKDRQAQDISQKHMKASAVDRVNNQIARLENDKEDLTNEKTREALRVRGEAKREINNAKRAFQENVEAYRRERDEAIRQGNQGRKEEIAKVRDDLEGQMVSTQRHYLQRMDEQNRIQRKAYDNLVVDHKTREAQTKVTADDRVKRVLEQTEGDKIRLIQLQNENHKTGQRLKQDEMKALRDAMADDKDQAVRTLHEEIQKREVQHSEKMNSLISKYERQVKSLNDELLRERKSNDENIRRLTEELQRAHKVQMDQLESKNRERLRQVNARHSEELRSVNKRHEERLDQTIGQMKKT